jgi:hypothetical protein
MKAPNSKLQAPEKHQISSTKQTVQGAIGGWRLEFLWSLDVGAWSFSNEV